MTFYKVILCLPKRNNYRDIIAIFYKTFGNSGSIKNTQLCYIDKYIKYIWPCISSIKNAYTWKVVDLERSNYRYFSDKSLLSVVLFLAIKEKLEDSLETSLVNKTPDMQLIPL